MTRVDNILTSKLFVLAYLIECNTLRVMQMSINNDIAMHTCK